MPRLTKPPELGKLCPVFVQDGTVIDVYDQPSIRLSEGATVTCAFISDHKIDSYLKLQVLLLLHRRPQNSASLNELADQLFVGDMKALQRQIDELRQWGLLRCEERRWTLQGQPAITYCLACLERTFDDPLARQRLLDQVARRNAG